MAKLDIKGLADWRVGQPLAHLDTTALEVDPSGAAVLDDDDSSSDHRRHHRRHRHHRSSDD